MSLTFSLSSNSATVVLGRHKQEKKAISTGTIVAIVITLLVIIIIIVAIVLFKYYRSRSQSVYTNSYDDSKPARFSALKTRVRAVVNPRGIHYAQERDQVDVLDDSKPFVDHEAL